MIVNLTTNITDIIQDTLKYPVSSFLILHLIIKYRNYFECNGIIITANPREEIINEKI